MNTRVQNLEVYNLELARTKNYCDANSCEHGLRAGTPWFDEGEWRCLGDLSDGAYAETVSWYVPRHFRADI